MTITVPPGSCEVDAISPDLDTNHGHRQPGVLSLPGEVGPGHRWFPSRPPEHLGQGVDGGQEEEREERDTEKHHLLSSYRNTNLLCLTVSVCKLVLYLHITFLT